MEQEIAEVVAEHGWFAANVYDNDPPFLYTIGLMQTFGHPEVIVFGLEPKVAHAICAAIVHAIRGGKVFASGDAEMLSLPGGAIRIGIRRVHPTQHPMYLGFAMGYFRFSGLAGELKAVEAFWPDRRGKFPFDVGCDLAVYQAQPRLDVGLTPREVREWNREMGLE